MRPLDQRHHLVAGAEDGIDGQASVHRFQGRDHRQHLEDGALAQVRLAGVRGAALGADAHFAAPALAAAQGQIGRLSQQDDLGADAVALDQRAEREPLGVFLQRRAHDERE